MGRMGNLGLGKHFSFRTTSIRNKYSVCTGSVWHKHYFATFYCCGNR